MSYESAKACAVLVEDTAKEANNNKNNKKASASASIAASNVIPSSSSENAADQNQPRNLPPDGTTFNQISLGPKQRLSHTLPAYGYWNVQFYQMEAAYVHFDLWLPRGASLGFYARRNALPTHTNYDMMEVIKGASTEARTTRSVQVRKILHFENSKYVVDIERRTLFIFVLFSAYCRKKTVLIPKRRPLVCLAL